MKLSQAIEDYSLCARHELGHSSDTYYTYSARLKQFAVWLKENGQPDPPVDQISKESVRRYYFGVARTGVRPRTLRSHLHALRALLGHLVDQGALAENVALLVPMPKLDDTNRKVVSDEEVQRLLEASTKQATDFRCVRDRAILAVLAFGALRRQELLDLNRDDVNLEARVLLVQKGKGSRRRQIPLCKELHEALTDWLAFRRTLKTKTEKLFTIPGGRPLGDEALRRMVREVAAIAGMRGDPRIQPHSIRHSAATRMLRNGMDLKSVSVWLGHADLRTTSIYLHSSEEELVKVADLAGFKPKEETPPSLPKEVSNGSSYFQRRRTSRTCR